jgi:hypothetical protein
MVYGPTLTAIFVRLAHGAGIRDWKYGGKDAPKIITASPIPNKAKPFPRFLPLNRGASSAITPLCTF